MKAPRTSRPRAAGRRPLRDDTWAEAVLRFERQELAEAPVGAAWKSRMTYEVRRTPRLLERAGVSPVPRSPGR